MRFRGELTVLAAALIWSTGGLAIKFVPLEGVTLAATRGFIAGLCFLPFLRPGRVERSWRLLGLLASYGLMNVTFVTATKLTAAGNAVALQYTAPLWIFAVQALAGRIELAAGRVLPVALGALGITLFLLEPESGTSALGNMLGLVSGVWFALTLSFYRLLRESHGPSLVCLTNFAAGLMLLPFLGDTGRFSPMGPAEWAGMIYLGAVQIGFAYFLYSVGVRRVPALRASMIALAEPLLNPVWVFLFLDERPTIYAVAGGLAILAAVSLDLRFNRPEKEESVGAEGEARNEGETEPDAGP